MKKLRIERKGTLLLINKKQMNLDQLVRSLLNSGTVFHFTETHLILQTGIVINNYKISKLYCSDLSTSFNLVRFELDEIKILIDKLRDFIQTHNDEYNTICKLDFKPIKY